VSRRPTSPRRPWSGDGAACAGRSRAGGARQPASGASRAPPKPETMLLASPRSRRGLLREPWLGAITLSTANSSAGARAARAAATRRASARRTVSS